MSDNFLYQYQEQPGNKFAQSLYQRISEEPVPFAVFEFSPLAQMGKTFTLMGLTLVVMMAFSPKARAVAYENVMGTR
jgi:hypothetical protein